MQESRLAYFSSHKLTVAVGFLSVVPVYSEPWPCQAPTAVRQTAGGRVHCAWADRQKKSTPRVSRIMPNPHSRAHCHP